MNKERLLIFRARALQDSAAFSSLVGMHQGKVRAFLLRLTHDYDLANDIAQETFIAGFNKLPSYKGSGSFCAWLLKIAYNKFLENKRSESRRAEISKNYRNEFDTLKNHFDAIDDLQMDLEKAMSNLKTNQIASITLCYSYGFSHHEAAQILNIPIGTVKTNIARGKDQLRTILNLVESNQESA